MKDFAIYSAKRKDYYTMPQYYDHDYYEVYYLLTGHRHYYFENKLYSIKKGSMLFIDKNEIHKSMDADIADDERFVLYFSSSFISRVQDEQYRIILSPFTEGNRKIQFDMRDQSYVERLLFQMHNEFNHPDVLGQEIFLQSLLIQLLLFAARKKREDPPDNREDPMNARIAEVVNYCNQQFREDLRLESLAEHFHISPFYLSRLFKRTTGFTFKEFVNTLRIREAEKLLRESNDKVIDISEQVGFANVSHFNRKFKQVTRMSPNEFKQITSRKKP